MALTESIVIAVYVLAVVMGLASCFFCIMSNATSVLLPLPPSHAPSETRAYLLRMAARVREARLGVIKA